VFRNASLAAAASELNRYNITKVIIADATTGKIGIGGTFPADDPGAFVRVAHELLGLHVEKHGDELVISN
jgi:ferric-dicitrate binding protein FerR (iron transport regulator)